MTGIKRYLVTCKKCGWEWMARTPNPKRCALCNNPNPDKPKVRGKAGATDERTR